MVLFDRCRFFDNFRNNVRHYKVCSGLMLFVSVLFFFVLYCDIFLEYLTRCIRKIQDEPKSEPIAFLNKSRQICANKACFVSSERENHNTTQKYDILHCYQIYYSINTLCMMSNLTTSWDTGKISKYDEIPTENFKKSTVLTKCWRKMLLVVGNGLQQLFKQWSWFLNRSHFTHCSRW